DIAAGTYAEAVTLSKFLGSQLTVAFVGKKDGSGIPTVILEGTGLGTTATGIHAAFAQRVTVQDIKFQNYGYAGFEAAFGAWATLTNVDTFNCGTSAGQGVRAGHAVVVLEGCTI